MAQRRLFLVAFKVSVMVKESHGGIPMARQFILSDEELQRCKELLSNPKDERAFRRGLVGIFLSQNRYTAAELAQNLLVTERTIYDDLAKIKNPDSVSTKQWGGARHCHLTFEEEKAFLDEYLEKAKAGTILTMQELHCAYNEIVGKTVPKSTFYRMLKRQGWNKKKPDTVHPKADKEAQERFKKKRSKFIWTKKTERKTTEIFPFV
jgi:transposase